MKAHTPYAARRLKHLRPTHPRHHSVGSSDEMPYSAEVASALQKELRECLEDANVQEEIAKWLVDNRIIKLEAFADLAESKAEIVSIVARAAGVDTGDAVKCQPLKTAWRRADAQVKEQTSARAAGREPDTEYGMSPEQRHKLDVAVEKRFHFRWPTSIIPSSALIAKIEATYRKKLQETPRIQEARSLLDKGAPSTKVTFSFKESGQGVMGTTVAGDGGAVVTVWAFRCKHLTIMIAYVEGDTPNFHIAEMTTMLDYHEWIMEKLHKEPRPKLGAIIEADFKMRTEWMLSYTNGEFDTITAAAKHHRSESIHLFANLPHADGPDGNGKRPRGPGLATSGAPPPRTPNANFGKGGKNAGKGNGTANSTKPCQFYNAPGGCRQGDSCAWLHKCNMKGCADPRPRQTHH